MKVHPDQYPEVSVLVPVKNEQQRIANCLACLIGQTYPKDKFEILVIDGMSEDRTREIVTRFTGDSKVKTSMPVIRLIDNPKGQRTSALNIGIKCAGGDVIVRVDARTEVPYDYVEKGVQTLIETGADNVGGVQKPKWNKGPNGYTQKTIGLALSHPFGVGDSQFRLGVKSGYVDTVYLGCFRKETFDRVGLFDDAAPVISEDSDINYRINKAGGKVYLDKDIVAYYYPRDNLRDFWKLYFRYGGARAGNLLKHKVLRARQFVPPVFIITLITLSILSFFNSLFPAVLGFIMGAYLLADIFASVSLALKAQCLAILPRLLVIFPCMHFGWGLGFLKRLITRPKKGQYWKY